MVIPIGEGLDIETPAMVIPIGEGLDIETPVIGYTNRRRFGYLIEVEKT